MSRQSMALLMAMAATSKRQGYALDVSCSPMDYARSLNHTKQQRIKRNGRKGKRETSTISDLSKIPTVEEFEKIKAELECTRAKLPKWHRCDKPNEDGFYDLPPESGEYFAQWETTWADGKTMRYCEPLEYDADNCDWPSLTNHAHVIQWCENPIPPEVV